MIAFGLIPSRRLGSSLGINNIVKRKQCSYNCVYCQVGKTTHKTTIRESNYEPEVLLCEVKNHLYKLDATHQPDYLTFVANGEPTLDLNLGEEITLLKQLNIPVAIITNASLLYNEKVKEEVMLADWVSVKVDALDESVWNKINQPEEGLLFEKVISGVQDFSSQYKGKLCTETMLIGGYNDKTKHLNELADFIGRLKPDTAYLSIPTRPTSIRGIHPVSKNKITEAWELFKLQGIHTELLTGFEGSDTGFTGNAFEDILTISSVHPLREDTLNKLLLKDNASNAVVRSLIHQGLIKEVSYAGNKYYLRNYLDKR